MSSMMRASLTLCAICFVAAATQEAQDNWQELVHDTSLVSSATPPAEGGTELSAQGSAVAYGFTQPPTQPPTLPPTTCSSTQKFFCQTEAACVAAKGEWDASGYEAARARNQMYGTYCTEPCSQEYKYSCKTEAACVGAKGQWSSGSGPASCSEPCSSKSKHTCKTEAACVGAKGQWVKTQHMEGCLEPCSTNYKYSCMNVAACVNAHGQWSGDPKRCGEPCSSTNKMQCKTETACVGVKGKWLTPGSSGCQQQGCHYGSCY